MPSVTGYLVRVFGQTPETGSPAAVVMNPTTLTEKQLQHVASCTAAPDTAFVWTDQPHQGQLMIRWFTPTKETTFCGHATLAAARVVREEYSAFRQDGQIEFNSAQKHLILTQEGDLDWLATPVPSLITIDDSRQEIADAFQMWVSETELSLPLVFTPERDIIIPLSLAADLGAVEPDWEKLTALGQQLSSRGFCLLSRQTQERTSSFSSRFFAPHFGIPEDPATGSIHGALALYALEHGWAKTTARPAMGGPGGAEQLPPNTVIRLRGEQGDAIGLPCRLDVVVSYEQNRPTAVRVGGLTSTPVRTSFPLGTVAT